MARLNGEGEPIYFELPPGADFQHYCLEQFLLIRTEFHKNVPNSTYDETTGFYSIETQLANELISRCSEYMGEEDLALVQKSLALMFLAHAPQYRDSKEPYSTHCLATAIEQTNKRYQQDGIQIASGLLHDTLEDTKVTEQIIREYIHPDVATTVVGDTKYRSRYIRKDMILERTRHKVAFSIVDFPRVIINKLSDRLHNMRTLDTLQSKKITRYDVILETQQIYIPLAKRLGLFEIAEEMDYLCILHDEREDQERLARLVQEHEKLSNEFKEQVVIDQISSVLGLGLEIHARLTSVASAYRNPEGAFHINVDITFNHEMNDISQWGGSMMNIAQKFVWRDHEFEVSKMPSADVFHEDILSGATDSLGFWVSPGYLEVPFHIHMYPRDVYELETARITDLYYTENVVNPNTEERRQLAEKKHKQLGQKLLQVSTTKNPYEVKAVRSFIRLMEPRLHTNFIQIVVFGENDRQLFDQAHRGSTVLDYVRFVRPDDWAKAERVTVNGQSASFKTVLHERDSIQIDYGSSVTYDPVWIFDFAIDRDGPEEVRKNIITILKKSDSETRDRLYTRILEVGAERLEQLLPQEEQPFRYGLQAETLHKDLTEAALVVEKFIFQNNLISAFQLMGIGGSRDNIEEYFRLGVGLGIIDQSLIDRIMSVARVINNKVMVIDVSFNANLTGQDAILTVLAAQHGISLIGDVKNDIYGKKTVKCHLYVMPEDTYKLPKLLNGIQRSLILRWKSFKSVRSHLANQKYEYFS
jgi:hypothetical protein